MYTKSANTKQFIIETVAPIFNKYGYAATGLSDLTKATGLTKGALYGNFKNKEEIALEAFNYNMKVLLKAISKKIDEKKSPINKLFAVTEFFKDYQKLTEDFGGCPILNVGVDSKNQNPLLHERVKYSIKKIIDYFESVIKEGIESNEIKSNINSQKYAKRIFTLIEGSVFMMTTLNDDNYISDMMDHINKMIRNEIIK